MAVNEQRSDERTSIKVDKATRSVLKDAKPFPSMTYDDLLRDMVDVYQEAERAP